MKKILTVFGTRPEAIKMCPLVIELKKRNCFETYVCLTGQHKEMVDPILEFFGIDPDYNLDIMLENQTLFDISSRTTERLRIILNELKPDAVAVHGDTTTAYAAALCAFYLNIPVIHIEAGLRTYDVTSPFPEEFNRVAIDKISKFCFAPTASAEQNLIREGKNESEIFVVGNTAIDALKYTADPTYESDLLNKAKGYRLITVTAHRRENLGDPMKEMFGAIIDIVEKYDDVFVIYPVHKNPIVRKAAYEYLGKQDRIILTEPMDTVEFHSTLAKSYLTLTDSGGIQEEAPSLGCPVVVMRNTTERPEAIEAGTAVLAGTERKSIFKVVSRILDDSDLHNQMKSAKNPFGDGKSSIKIADILEKHFI